MYFIENDQVLEVEVISKRIVHYHNDYLTHYFIKIVESGDLRFDIQEGGLEEDKSVAVFKLHTMLSNEITTLELEIGKLKDKLKLLEGE